MTRNHWMLFGFFMAIVGMGVYSVAPLAGRLLVWLGAVLAWLGIAVAIESKPWAPIGRALLQAIVGAAAVAIAMSATRFSLAGIGLATLLGAVIGAFASHWTRYFVKS
ncbi:MAG: hypothetical protein JNL19_12090 [Burkholderiales bacterium]|nr:hypothetical protein [Burkholderiales bacterium]